jgi:hypothetical protein
MSYNTYMPLTPEDKPYSPLEPGDILIGLINTAPTDSKHLDKHSLAEEAWHAAIYKGRYAKKTDAIAHSAITEHAHPGVHAHSITSLFKPDQETLGNVLVLRFKNQQLREALAKLEDSRATAQAFTPFKNWGDRREDNSKSQKQIQRFEFFRAFRIYQRIAEEKPLSKNQGMSCILFVSNMIKAAIIKKLFPNGLPENIKAQLNKIETERKEKHAKKLDQVDTAELELFEKLVLENLRGSEAEIQELYQVTKNLSPTMFSHRILENPDLCEMGYLYYNDETRPCMMTHSLYCAIAERRAAQSEHPNLAQCSSDEIAMALGEDPDLSIRMNR